MYGFVGSASSTATSGSSKTTSYSPAGGNALFLPVYYNGSSALTISSLKDQSNNPIAYTQVASLYDGSSENGLDLLVVPSAPAGITAITVTLSGATASGIALGVYEYSGLSSTFDPSSTAVTATPSVAAGGTISAPGITNAKQPAILFAMTLDFGHENQPASAGSGFTLRPDTPVDSGGNTAFLEIEDQRVTTSGTPVAATFISGSPVTDTWAAIAVMLDEAGGAALASTASDATAGSATLTNFAPPGWISLSQWNVGTSAGEKQRRFVTYPTVFASTNGLDNGCGEVLEIYPLDVGTSGSFTITDNGVEVFTIAAADVVAGVPIPVGVICRSDITISSVPTGGEYGVSWELYGGARYVNEGNL